MEKHFILVLGLLIILQLSRTHDQGSYNIVSVTGMLANLPCNITPPVLDDEVNLVLWYKDGYGKPIYSFDLRNRSVAPRLKLEAPPRALFDVSATPTAVLSLFGITREDVGIFSCRVDFKKSPTRYWNLNVTVIDPPTAIVITDDRGKTVTNGSVFTKENATLIVTCDVVGGWPGSSAIWLKDGKLFDDSYLLLPERISRNQMIYKNPTRGDHKSEFTCIGSNNNLTSKLTKTLTLYIKMLPQSIYIETEGRLISGQEHKFKCVTEGGFPQGKILWRLMGELINSTHEETLGSNDENVSEITILLEARHDGKSLECVVMNRALNATLRTSKLLKVQYSPQVEVSLGVTLKEDQVYAGDDIYLECHVEANPDVRDITWLKDDEKVQHKHGINENSLIIQNVTKDNGGYYSCKGENAVGSGLSEELYLDVKYAPVCKKSGTTIQILTQPDEEINVVCQVDANPPPEKFTWKYNATSAFLSLPKENVHSENFLSVTSLPSVNATGMSVLLLCWAENDIGKQEIPCSYILTKEGPPEAPQNCRLFYKTAIILVIECIPGPNNGIQQEFHMQIWRRTKKEKKMVVEQKNRHFPYFTVQQPLSPATNMDVIIFSQNVKGSSKKNNISFTPKENDREFVWITKESNGASNSLVFFILSFVASAVLLGCCVVASKRRSCGCRANKANTSEVKSSQLLEPIQLQEFDTNMTRF